MVSPERNIRLPLNISESRETTTGRFLTTASGAGVQHIALTTGNIVEAEHRAKQMPPVTIIACCANAGLPHVALARFIEVAGTSLAGDESLIAASEALRRGVMAELRMTAGVGPFCDAGPNPLGYPRQHVVMPGREPRTRCFFPPSCTFAPASPLLLNISAVMSGLP